MNKELRIYVFVRCLSLSTIQLLSHVIYTEKHNTKSFVHLEALYKDLIYTDSASMLFNLYGIDKCINSII